MSVGKNAAVGLDTTGAETSFGCCSPEPRVPQFDSTLRPAEATSDDNDTRTHGHWLRVETGFLS